MRPRALKSVRRASSEWRQRVIELGPRIMPPSAQTCVVTRRRRNNGARNWTLASRLRIGNRRGKRYDSRRSIRRDDVLPSGRFARSTVARGKHRAADNSPHCGLRSALIQFASRRFKSDLGNFCSCGAHTVAGTTSETSEGALERQWRAAKEVTCACACRFVTGSLFACVTTDLVGASDCRRGISGDELAASAVLMR